MSLIKSRRRVSDHGEVFTPPWLVDDMLSLVKDETDRIDSRFLEPACGSGNFLVRVLQRKLAIVELKFAQSEFEKQHFALLCLMCVYGIEILTDNVVECREKLIEVFAEYLDLEEADDLYRAASVVLARNLIEGDAITMRTNEGNPIIFSEWGYIGKGKFQRRDFLLDKLAESSVHSTNNSLLRLVGNREIFNPAMSYDPMTVKDLASNSHISDTASP